MTALEQLFVHRKLDVLRRLQALRSDVIRHWKFDELRRLFALGCLIDHWQFDGLWRLYALRCLAEHWQFDELRRLDEYCRMDGLRTLDHLSILIELIRLSV
jgi:hypothetical protein